MKTKLFLLIAMLCCIDFLGLAQDATIPEPEYVGVPMLVNDDNTLSYLEKQVGTIKTKNNWMKLIPTSEVYLEINGKTSPIRLSMGLHRMVVKYDQNVDPSHVVYIYKMESKKKQRKIKLAQRDTFDRQEDTKDLVKYAATPFGQSSMLIEFGIDEPGEYCVLYDGQDFERGSFMTFNFGVDK